MTAVMIWVKNVTSRDISKQKGCPVKIGHPPFSRSCLKRFMKARSFLYVWTQPFQGIAQYPR
jgi:hypothetical protein